MVEEKEKLELFAFVLTWALKLFHELLSNRAHDMGSRE